MVKHELYFNTDEMTLRLANCQTFYSNVQHMLSCVVCCECDKLMHVWSPNTTFRHMETLLLLVLMFEKPLDSLCFYSKYFIYIYTIKVLIPQTTQYAAVVASLKIFLYNYTVSQKSGPPANGDNFVKT